MPTHYETLGVSPEATQKEIKKAFNALALQHHPDKGGDPEKMQQITEAYAVLSDPDKKSEYDLELQIAQSYDQKFSEENEKGAGKAWLAARKAIKSSPAAQGQGEADKQKVIQATWVLFEQFVKTTRDVFTELAPELNEKLEEIKKLQQDKKSLEKALFTLNNDKWRAHTSTAQIARTKKNSLKKKIKNLFSSSKPKEIDTHPNRPLHFFLKSIFNQLLRVYLFLNRGKKEMWGFSSFTLWNEIHTWDTLIINEIKDGATVSLWGRFSPEQFQQCARLAQTLYAHAFHYVMVLDTVKDFQPVVDSVFLNRVINHAIKEEVPPHILEKILTAPQLKRLVEPTFELVHFAMTSLTEKDVTSPEFLLPDGSQPILPHDKIPTLKMRAGLYFSQFFHCVPLTGEKLLALIGAQQLLPPPFFIEEYDPDLKTEQAVYSYRVSQNTEGKFIFSDFILNPFHLKHIPSWYMRDRVYETDVQKWKVNRQGAAPIVRVKLSLYTSPLQYPPFWRYQYTPAVFKTHFFPDQVLPSRPFKIEELDATGKIIRTVIMEDQANSDYLKSGDPDQKREECIGCSDYDPKKTYRPRTALQYKYVPPLDRVKQIAHVLSGRSKDKKEETLDFSQHLHHFNLVSDFHTRYEQADPTLKEVMMKKLKVNFNLFKRDGYFFTEACEEPWQEYFESRYDWIPYYFDTVSLEENQALLTFIKKALPALAPPPAQPDVDEKLSRESFAKTLLHRMLTHTAHTMELLPLPAPAVAPTAPVPVPANGTPLPAKPARPARPVYKKKELPPFENGQCLMGDVIDTLTQLYQAPYVRFGKMLTDIWVTEVPDTLSAKEYFLENLNVFLEHVKPIIQLLQQSKEFRERLPAELQRLKTKVSTLDEKSSPSDQALHTLYTQKIEGLAGEVSNAIKERLFLFVKFVIKDSEIFSAYIAAFKKIAEHLSADTSVDPIAAKIYAYIHVGILEDLKKPDEVEIEEVPVEAEEKRENIIEKEEKAQDISSDQSSSLCTLQRMETVNVSPEIATVQNPISETQGSKESQEGPQNDKDLAGETKPPSPKMTPRPIPSTVTITDVTDRPNEDDEEEEEKEETSSGRTEAAEEKILEPNSFLQKEEAETPHTANVTPAKAGVQDPVSPTIIGESLDLSQRKLGACRDDKPKIKVKTLSPLHTLFGAIMYAALWAGAGGFVGVLALGLASLAPMMLLPVLLAPIAGAFVGYFGFHKLLKINHDAILNNASVVGVCVALALVVAFFAFAVNPFTLMGLAAVSIGVAAAMIVSIVFENIPKNFFSKPTPKNFEDINDKFTPPLPEISPRPAPTSSPTPSIPATTPVPSSTATPQSSAAILN